MRRAAAGTPTRRTCAAYSHRWDFNRGDTAGLRLRPARARARPWWDEADSLFAYLPGLCAFGLELSNRYLQSEDVGRRSLATNPGVPWAMHAVVHVMEMQRRFEDAAWLRLHQPAWVVANGFACHLWWHKSLFRLGRRSLCRALNNERRMAKPMAPLTRHWMDHLNIPEAAR